MKRIVLAFLFWTFVQAGFGADYKVFQFPVDKTPSIDGQTSDWGIVPESYVLTIQDMVEDEGKHMSPDISTLDVTVKVGWSKGDNRLYFLYEAYDNYWRFSDDNLSTDIFEVVVDGNCSGGEFIDRFHPDKKADIWQRWFNFHGCHAQNYHIFTPPHRNDWCMYWGPQTWLKKQPYAKYAYDHNVSEGGAGKLTLEFYITPFDHADANGANLSTETTLVEGNYVGIAWAIIDWDQDKHTKDGFWNLADNHLMYGDATYLRKFKLMAKE